MCLPRGGQSMQQQLTPAYIAPPQQETTAPALVKGRQNPETVKASNRRTSTSMGI